MADISFLVFKDEQGFYRLVGDEAKGETIQRVDVTEEMKPQRLLAFLQTFDYNTEVEYFPNTGESYTTTTGEWLDANDGNGDELAEFVVRQGNDILFATPEGEPLSPTDPVFTILDPRLTQ